MQRIEEIRRAVESGYPKLMEKLIFQALTEDISPAEIMESALVPAMNSIGRLYQNDECELMQILVDARCVQKGMDILLPQLEPQNRFVLGKVILGTVEGDLHDVGKKLVAVMMQSVGFEVIDLGVDISGKRFVKAAKEHPDASIICLSCLLTTSMRAMRNAVELIKGDKSLSHLRVMVGGCPITESFARSIGADAYTENAAEAAQLAKKFVLDGRNAP